METRTTRPRRPRNRKSQLAAVAAELFRARGYRGVGITDIAAAAGVTGPAVYRHFSDKQAILAHVVLSGVDDLVAMTAHALEGPKAPGPDQITLLMRSLAKLSVERREAAALWRSERRHLRAEDQAELRRRSSGLLTAWARALRSVRPELSLGDAELLSWAALSVFGSVSVHSTRIGKRRFESLLVERARAVLHCTLPTANGAPVHATPERSDQRILRVSRREQLITEASRLFQERGFHEVSMEGIGAAAGISGPSVYRHFPSKAALFVASATRLADRLEQGRQQVSRSAADEAQALRDLTASYVGIMRTSAGILGIGAQVNALSEAENAEMRRVQRDYVEEWVRLLCTIRPELSAREGRIVVHVSLTIANDLLRTRRMKDRPNIETELVALMCATLDVP
ncbi:MAG: TetR/AcrR family transcriptional regulator [Pseudonocardiaceae bacterium]